MLADLYYFLKKEEKLGIIKPLEPCAITVTNIRGRQLVQDPFVSVIKLSDKQNSPLSPNNLLEFSPEEFRPSFDGHTATLQGHVSTSHLHSETRILRLWHAKHSN